MSMRTFFALAAALALLLSVAPVAFAASGAPKILNYQGRLMDSSGSPLGGGGTNYCFKFSFYDSATVGSGTKLWPSISPSTMTISVKNGIFDAGIGDVSAGGDTLDFNFNDTDTAYLNVDVATMVGPTCAPGDGAEVYETLSPRQRLYSAGYALNANSLAGFGAAQNASGNQIPVLSSGNLILGGTNPNISATTTNALVIQGSSTGDIRFFNTSNSISSSGNLNLSGAAIANSIGSFTTLTVGGTSTSTIQGSTTGTSTIQGFINVLGTNSTSTFSGGLAAAYLNLTGSTATSSAASGINLSGGCFAQNGNCLNNISLSALNTWLSLQIFGAGYISQGSTTVTGQFNTRTLNVTSTSTLGNATSSSLAVTSLPGALLSTDASGNVGSTTVTPTLSFNNRTLALNLANPNVWSGLQTFGNASSSMLDSILQFARTIQSTSTNALALKSNLSSIAGLTLGGTSTPQILSIDTLNNRAQFGNGAGVAAPILAVLDTKNTSGDPSGVDGAQYYNSNTAQYRCFASGAWRTCGGQAASSTGAVQFTQADGSFGGDTDFVWSMANHGLTIMGNSGQTGDLFTVASSTGAAMFDISSNGIVELATTTPPATSPTSGVQFYGRDIAGRGFVGVQDVNGQSTPLQPLFARNKIGYWNPPGNATTVPGVFGFTAPTVVGTATARNVATTNVATRMRRLGYVSSATAGSFSEQRVAVAQYTVGTGSGLGGFTLIVRFVPSDAASVSGERFFIGVSSATGVATNVEPSTLTNSIGLAQLSTSNNLQIVWGGSAAQTPIDLGAGFPANTLSTEAYELALYSSPNSNNVVGYTVTRLSTGASTSGTLTGTAGTAIPSSSTLLTYRAWKTNNATALAVGFDIASVYIETDN